MARGFNATRGFAAAEDRLLGRKTAEKKLASLGVRPMGELTQDSYRAFEPVTAGKGFKNDRDNPASLINTELNFRNDTVENAAVFDGKTGEAILAHTSNKESEVILSSSMIEKCRKLGGEAIFTHNHPGSSAFSAEDFGMLLYGNFKEVRIVSGRYSYSLSDPSGRFRKAAFDYGKKGGFKKGFTMNDMFNVEDEIRSARTQAEEDALINDSIRLAEQNGTNPDIEFNILSRNQIVEKMARRFGLDFRRIPLTPASK